MLTLLCHGVYTSSLGTLVDGISASVSDLASKVNVSNIKGWTSSVIGSGYQTPQGMDTQSEFVGRYRSCGANGMFELK